MITFLMIGSLILGLISLILPSINIIRYNKNYDYKWSIYSILSISLLAITLSSQLIYNNILLKTEDWSALMDTAGASTLISIILLIITLILNLISLSMYHSKQ